MEFQTCINEEVINIVESFLNVFTEIFKPVSGSVDSTFDPVTCIIEKANDTNIYCPFADIIGSVFDPFDCIFNNINNSNIIEPFISIVDSLVTPFDNIFNNISESNIICKLHDIFYHHFTYFVDYSSDVFKHLADIFCYVFNFFA